MTSKRRVYLAAHQKYVALGKYIAFVKCAIADPDARFQYTLTQWWGGFGREIRKEFRDGMHDRINQHLSWYNKGRRWDKDYWWKLWRDVQRIRGRRHFERLETQEMEVRYGGRFNVCHNDEVSC